MTLILVTVGAASASPIACAPDTLDNFLGNYAVCGTMTFDFTAGFYSAGGGATLATSDILVTPGFSYVNFSVVPGAGGAFATTGAGNGYSTFEIGYTASIDPAFYFNGVQIRANNIHFDNFNGATDSADALKLVAFGAGPDIFTVDAAASADTSAGGGAVDIPFVIDSTSFLPLTTTSMFVDDTITLNPGGTPGLSIQSIDNLFTTPEPVTFLSLGTALAALGLFRRRNRK